MEKLRILYAVQSLGKGGAERIVLDICNELSLRENIETLIVSFSDINEYKNLSKNANIRICKSTVSLSIFKRNRIDIDSYKKIVDEFEPHIIHSNVYISELITREYLVEGAKYFTHCHNNIPEFKSFQFSTLFNKKAFTKYFEKKRIENRFKKCNNSFIAISNHTLDYFKNNLPRSLTKRISLLPNSIDFNRFYNTQKHFIGNELRLIMVGHMANYKNQIFLVNVLEKLKAKNIKLSLLGDWRENGEKIQEKAKKYGIEHLINMPGNVENVEEYLSQSDIYVHSAYYEPFGLVLLEAMAAGLPVVCLDGGGNRDIIENGKNGFIIKNQNVDEFVERILELHNNQNLYSEISSYAQQYAKHYDIKPYVDKLLDIYQKAPACSFNKDNDGK